MQEQGSEALAEMLGKAVRGKWEELHFEVECQTAEGFQALEVFGSGVAIWDFHSQFSLDRGRIRESLRLFRELEFASMPEKFGGPSGEEPKPPGHAVRVTCRVVLDVNGVSKQVVQLDKGEQSPQLKQLASGLFEISSKPSRKSVRPKNLSEGLGMLAAGRLAPVVLRVLVNRKPESADIRSGEPGWILRIQRGKISVQCYSTSGTMEETRTARLDGSRLRQLASLFRDQGVGSLPVNLHARHYTDVSIEVLNHKKGIQAREFAGMTSRTHGEKQVAFDRIYEFLDELQESVGH